MKNLLLVALLADLLLGSNAFAGGYALAKKHMCTSCHSLDRKSMGPSWMSISVKYQTDKTADAYLIDKIRNGGTGVWGSAAMPPSHTMDEADIKILAQYILGLTKE